MKIVHVITAFGIGGAEKLLLNIINKQIVDHEVHLVYLKKVDDLRPQLHEKVIIKNIPLSFIVSKKLRNYFKNVHPDIIHTHLGHADILGIWGSRNLDSKVFCTMHNISFKNNSLDKIIFKLYKFLFLKVSKQIQVISISKSVENHVIDKLSLPREQSHLLFNAISRGVNTESIEKIKIDLKIPQGKIILLFVGRLTKQKSIKTLLKSIKVLKENGYGELIQLLIVGKGRLKESLELLSNELLISDLVRFEGETSSVDNYFKIADIFILPSIWEGFGIVILEAFRSKLAVIASNVEGPSELISHDENGLLFKPKDHLELSGQIVKLIDDENLRKKMAHKGFESLKKNYQINTYVEKLNRLYTRSLNG